MATDPVEGIQVEELDHGFSTNLQAALREIARLEPSTETPYLSIYLDWRPEGERPQRRSAKTLFDHQAAKMLDSHDEESTQRKSVHNDVERITEFLEDDLDPSVHGVIIIANDGQDVFETFVLAMPVETRITHGPTPDLLPMARLVEDYPRYAVLLADAHDATLEVINRASRVQRVSIQGSEYPRYHKQGGWSQRRFQTRAIERRAHFVRAIAEETRRALYEGQIDKLIVAGNEPIRAVLNNEFHEEVKSRIIGEIGFDKRASRAELIESTIDIVEQAERKEEAETLKALHDAVGSGNRGVVGVEPTLRALERGQVLKLVMSSEFHHDGWADYTMQMFGVGPVPSHHPGGGDTANIYPIDIAEEMVRLTVVTDAEGEIIHEDGASPTRFEEQVGALLRFET
ncbi:MAG: Vms1/Ankzf1 family peptidyl-tRNA hydrolase [Chloroflexota bacterium]